jgi:hypothetical protein
MHSGDSAVGLLLSVGRDDFSGTANRVIGSSEESSVDGVERLSALLQHLGANSAANHWLGQNDVSIARASATITGWLTYLPAACVRTMVNDGWHWST